MDTSTMLRFAADRAPAYEAVVEGDRRLSYGELLEAVESAASGMRGLGLDPGDRLVMAVANSVDAVICMLATQMAGVVAVPVNHRLRSTSLGAMARRCGARALVIDENTTEDLEKDLLAACPVQIRLNGTDRAPHAVSLGELIASHSPLAGQSLPADDDVSIVLFTSGTNGMPKAVPITHRQNTARVTGLFRNHGFRHDDDMRCLGLMPIYHTVGIHAGVLLSLHCDGTYFPVRRFVPADVLELVERESISYVFGAPTMFKALVDDPRRADFDLSSVRDAMYAGQAMDATLVERVSLDLAVELTHVYGNTETYNSLYYRSAGSCPGALRVGIAHRVRIASLEPGCDDPAAPGVEGELLVDMRSDEAFSGYEGDPAATASCVRDGWYHTGDVAVVDSEDRIFLKGRTDDMIISGGENIHPAEIANVLLTHPGVADCAVTGVPDEFWGESVVALVVPRNGDLTIEALAEFCGHNRDLDGFKKPKHLFLVDQLPYNNTGKTDVSEVRHLARSLVMLSGVGNGTRRCAQPAVNGIPRERHAHS